MNIGVIGTGQIGEVIIRKLRDAGYPVKMANSRGPESLKNLAANTGAIPVSVEQVVQEFKMSICSSLLSIKRRFQNYRKDF
jgi:8-hydroxy-5-deazaflavin:NADPH oxidoreductase